MNNSPRLPRLRRSLLIGILLTLAFNFVVRWHLRDMPLERDEGEYAYAGQLILQGIPPYKLAFNMKFPGSYFMYAVLLAIFGQSAAGIHCGIILVTSLTALLIFFIGREILGEFGALIAAVIYTCLAALPKAAGLAGHATHFVSLFVCAGVFALLVARKRNSFGWWFISGTAFGLGILMKQHAVFFPAFILIWFLWKSRMAGTSPLASGAVADVPARAERAEGANSETLDCSCAARRGADGAARLPYPLLFCAGCLVPLIATAIGFACVGLWHAFVFWTFQYARQYVSMLPLRAAPGQFATGFGPVFESGIWVWIFGIVGLICLFWPKGTHPHPHPHPATADHLKTQKSHPPPAPSPLPSDGRGEGQGEVRASGNPNLRALASVIFLAGMAAACPGFYFRNHYFLMAMPGLALLNAAFILTAANILKTARIPGGPGASRWLPLCLTVFIVGDFAVNNGKMWFNTGPAQLSKELYGGNLFAEAVPIASYLRAHTSPADTIAVLGSEPEIFFLSHRHSASGYIYMYSLTEPQPLAPQMGREFISQIETARPKYVVSVNMGLSWYSLIMPESFRQAAAIQNWWAGYSTNYDLVGTVKISPDSPSQFTWNESSLDASNATNDDLLIYRQKAMDARIELPVCRRHLHRPPSTRRVKQP